ncbi:MAG: DNA mismatch repair protein MutS [Candidatus Marinimicrobia bacterium]|nr:DNA mismatch repair protein MutS [Candidatus Neomarinimicrobiota bacterium]
MKKTEHIDESTPVMRQFNAIKSKYPDALLLFRMGDFYETFREDAKTAAKILNITLTKRANGKASSVPLAGFPYHALDNYLHKLIRAGLKVAICEQVEDPKLAKGIVKREVVELVTPGTAITDNYLEKEKNNYLISVTFNETVAGIATIDVSTGEFYLSETVPERLKETVLALQPSEILCPEHLHDEVNALFANQVLRVTVMEDFFYSYEMAYETLTNHFRTQSLKGYGCEKATLGIMAAGPIISYLRQNHQTNLGHISSLRLQSDKDFVLIDEFTQRNLELFRTMQTGGERGTLFNVINETVTPAGSRLLVKWIRAPLQVIPAIKKRHDRVEFFLAEHDQRNNFRKILSKTSDLERLLSRLSTNRAGARELNNLKSTLELVPEIAGIIDDNAIFSDLKSDLRPLESLVKALNDSIKDQDLPLSIREGGFIRDGYSRELDEFRYIIKHGKEWILQMQAGERDKLGIPSLKVGYNRVFGYYIDVTKPHVDKVPETYIRKQTLVNSERFITPELKEYEEKLLTAEEKIAALEYEMYQSIRDAVLKEIVSIQRNAAVIAELDALCSFAHIADRNNYHRPEITNSSRIFIKDGRHPVVESLLPPGENFIPNDTDVDNKENQILIITGPNMAGKSTYLRQVGIMVLMAQMGSFIPAEEASIGVVDKIFTRVGASDNLAAGESTFLMEMNETANILNNVTPRSLILLDEIGRGTSTYDGMSIAWAVTEYLHQHKEVAAKTLFATHYHELTELEKYLKRVRNLNVAVKEYGDRVVFLRKIIPGGCDKSYGIHVAQMAGIPMEVIHRANEIMSNLSSDERVLPTDKLKYKKMPEPDKNQLGLFDQRESELRKKLNEVDVDTMTPLEALQKLNQLKKEYGS